MIVTGRLPSIAFIRETFHCLLIGQSQRLTAFKCMQSDFKGIVSGGKTGKEEVRVTVNVVRWLIYRGSQNITNTYRVSREQEPENKQTNNNIKNKQTNKKNVYINTI